MKRLLSRSGFTLVEVNLAIFIMAVGVLSMCALYGLGYRENRQSLEDVRGAAVAEANLSLLTAALSSTNMTWKSWTSIGTYIASMNRIAAIQGMGINAA